MKRETKQILEELEEIKSELNYIRRHMIDLDIVLTDDDIGSLKEAEINLKEGKTKRLN